MKLSNMSKAELEQMSYSELTEEILKEGTPLNTLEIFRKICQLLELDEEVYNDKIGDYYTSLATDKTFILLPDGKWDLQTKHPANINLNDEEIEDEEDLEMVDEAVSEMEEMASDIDDIDEDIDEDDIENDIEDDLTIIPEEELDD